MLNRLIFIESWPPCVCVNKKFSFKIHRHSVLQVLFYSFDTCHTKHIRSDQFTLVWARYKQCGFHKDKMKVRLLWYFCVNCVWWLWWSGTGNTFLAVLWLSTLPDSSKKLQGLGIPLLPWVTLGPSCCLCFEHISVKWLKFILVQEQCDCPSSESWV